MVHALYKPAGGGLALGLPVWKNLVRVGAAAENRSRLVTGDGARPAIAKKDDPVAARPHTSSQRGAAPTQRRAGIRLAGAGGGSRARERAARHVAVGSEPTIGEVRELLDGKRIGGLNEDATLTARRRRRAVDALLAGVRVAIQLPIELREVLRPDSVAHVAHARAALTSVATGAATRRHRAPVRCAAGARVADTSGDTANSSGDATTTSHGNDIATSHA
jgi:hypothetical protein